MTTQGQLQQLKAQLEDLYSVMPETFAGQKHRDQAAFLLSREIEKLENNTAYAENAAHWDSHELRF